MCGRFSLNHPPEEIVSTFGLADVERFPPRYNIAPTQPVLVVSAAPAQMPGSNRPDREAGLMRWGLLPSWVKDPKDFPTLINARSETAATKPSFRAAMRHRRCIVPASGFYEWQRNTQTKQSQAWWVPRSNGDVAAFAALHETYIGHDGSEIDTVAILTTEATGTFAQIHNRIPVVLSPADFARWMDCKTQEPRDVADLLREPPLDYFQPVPVSDAVNKVANSGPHIQQAVTPKNLDAEEKTNEQPGEADTQLPLF
ncbi:MAG: SOS response-associated peptidase [Ahrensia sp.]